MIWVGSASVKSVATEAQLVPFNKTSLPIPDEMEEENPPATVNAQRQRTAVKSVGRIRVKQRLAMFCHVQRSCERVHTADTAAISEADQLGILADRACKNPSNRGSWILL